MPWWDDAILASLYLRLFGTPSLTPGRTRPRRWPGSSPPLESADRGRGSWTCAAGRGGTRCPWRGPVTASPGLDRSTYLLEQAQDGRRRAGVDGRMGAGRDARALPWHEQFDACINLFTSFGYFEDEADNQQVLHQVCRRR